MSRTLGLVLGIVFALLVIGGVIAFFAWWKISHLKEKLVQDLEKEIGAEVHLASLDFDFWNGELRAAGITLNNVRPGAPWNKAEIGQATVRFHTGDLFADKMPITVDVSSWKIALHLPPAEPGSDLSPAPDSASDGQAAPANRVVVTKLTGHEGQVQFTLPEANQPPVVLTGVSFESTSNGTPTWTTQAKAQSISFGALKTNPPLLLITSSPDKIGFSYQATLGDQSEGSISGVGEIGLKVPHQILHDIKAANIPVSMLVTSPWQMKMEGLVSGQLSAKSNDLTPAKPSGKISVSHGKFNVLPALSKAIVLIGLPDLSNIEVDKATSDFEWSDGTLHLTNLDIRKTDIVRVAGTVDVPPSGDIDAKLKLGLPTTIIAKWPDLQKDVFSVALEDYSWAEVHVTGTPDNLKEDLSPRLVSVGLNTGGSLLDQAKKKATDLFNSFMGK